MAKRLRNKSLGIRLSEKEWIFVKNKIQKSRLSQREFLLNCLMNKDIIVKPNGLEVVKELKAIGNNLNQIAKKVNSYEISNCSYELNNIYNQIGELMNRWQ